jgi:hypothetical protein
VYGPKLNYPSCLVQFSRSTEAHHGVLPWWSLKTEQRAHQQQVVGGEPGRRSRYLILPRKEVIQPQLPLRLPCYDFTPITGPTFDGSLLAVRPPASGVTRFRGVTGGVYKARERIHRSIADLRLLATPPSWRRVSASNPNRDALYGICSTSRYCCPLYAPM